MSKWDERYLTDDYVFGTEPNQFIARILPLLPKGGRALDLATGEGGNGRTRFRGRRGGYVGGGAGESAKTGG